MVHLIKLLVLSAFVALTSGCVALPIAAMANLAHKSGTMTVTLEGEGDAIKAFSDAAVRAGGTVPVVQSGFARAEFSNVDLKVEAQVLPGQKRAVTLRGSSLSNVGRTYELKDNIGEVTTGIAEHMKSVGFVVKESKRDRGI